ncbi:DUF1583 domain-containing protein [Roseiconus nitratireducens]|nr:DUF1583 domain-containing protein [Roseiconus nitratireducens]
MVPTLALLVADVLAGGHALPVRAGDPDSTALNRIFGESTLQQNAVQACRSARHLPLAEHYDSLMHWVLPGDGHGLRIAGAIVRTPGRSPDQADPQVIALADYPESDWILCPARDLVQISEKLGRLSDLRARIDAVQPSSEQHSLAKRTLMTLIDVAVNDRDAIEQALADRFSGLRRSTDEHAHDQWWTDLLVLWTVTENPDTSDLVIEDFFGVYPELRLKIVDPTLDVIADYLSFLHGHRTRQNYAFDLPVNEQPLEGLDVFSRSDAASHGRAAPLTRFCFDDRGVVKVSGHEVDYIACRSPVAGGFEVVGEVATRPNAFSKLMVDGVACQPMPDSNKVSVARFGGGSQTRTIDPGLEPLDGRTLLRAVSRDAKTEHYCNGRLVFSTAPTGSSAPWAAIQSWRRSICEITDFRLAGDPAVPDRIDLLADDSLSGWASYDDPALGDWRAVVDEKGNTMVVEERSASPAGSHDESLLYYVRPIVWDARITYEFQFRDGVCSVDPCLGRSVFQIRPDGVRLHRITDGRFERSELRPDNSLSLNLDSKEPSSGVNPTPPLQDGWNQAELSIQGDQLEIFLNGDPIVRHRIKPHTVRTFGLFHNRDRTRAVVRHVNLAGDWPKSIPPLQEQTLASKIVNELNAASERLPQRWQHDFRRGAPSEFFHLGGNTDRVSQQPDGLHMDRIDDSDKLAMDFCGIIDGDFDVVASFKDLKIGTQKPTWHCGFGIATHLQNQDRSRLDLCLRRDRLNSLHHIAFSHNEVNKYGGIRWISDSTSRDQSSSGRLRLIRRGRTVHGFFAGGDSTCFRPIGSATVPLGPVPPQLLRLYTVGGDGMHVSGTWVDLSIRAERIDLLKPDNESASLRVLNQERDQKAELQIDFAKQTLEESGLTISSGRAEDLERTPRGWVMNAGGGTAPNRIAVTRPMRPTRAFDIEWEFERQRASGKVADQMTGEAVLRLRLAEQARTKDDPTYLPVLEAILTFRHEPDGRIALTPSLVVRRRDGKLMPVRLRTREIETPETLRIVQHADQLYFLYRDTGSPTDRIIATYPLKYPVSATSTEVSAAGTRDNGTMQILSKRLTIRSGNVALSETE